MFVYLTLKIKMPEVRDRKRGKVGDMLDYEKKLKYFDYLENGEKKRTAGFVKIEKKGEYCDIQVSVNGVGGTSLLDREIRLEFGKREEVLGSLSIREGKGNLTVKHLNRERLCELSPNQSSYEALTGIRIFMGKEKELYCAWREAGVGTLGKRKDEESVLKEDKVKKNTVAENTEERNTTSEDNMAEYKAAEERGQSRMFCIKQKESAEPKQEPEQILIKKMETKEMSVEKEGTISGTAVKEEEKEVLKEKEEAMIPEAAVKEKEREALEEKEEAMIPEAAVKEEEKEVLKEKEEAMIPEAAVKEKEREALKEKEEAMIPEAAVKEEEREALEEKEEAMIPEAAVKEKEREALKEKEATITETGEKEIEKEASMSELKGSPEVNETDNRGRKNGMAYSKWQQLWYLYPHRIPFHDDREYLSVRPEDFVILSSRSYKLINNSFLLHGFFNYDYLLLGRMEKEGKEKFYIGVPGSFYEREKQVALMFGFESFECEKEPAKVGDFGYYMIPVEL